MLTREGGKRIRFNHFRVARPRTSRLDAADAAKYILEVNQDVLGCLVYERPSWFGEPLTGRVELYYGGIGMMARLLGVRIEPLTVVVLAHKLSHAYTHLGADIDHHRWETAAFHATQHELAEGLAQYYTCLVCRRLESQKPSAPEAYDLLLQRQPPAYHTHEPWLEEYITEEVRFAMLQIRRHRPGCVRDFTAAQPEARARPRVSDFDDE